MSTQKFLRFEHLAVGLLVTVGVSALFSAINVLAFGVPRIFFIATSATSFAILLAIVFQLIHEPLKQRAYPNLLPNLALLLLFSVSALRLATSSFSEDDEIYSWNLWAVQHFEGKQADFQFTGVPYPQLFSYWIAALYHAMGSTVIQSFPRFFLSIPTLIVGLAIVGATKRLTWKSAAITALILFVVIAPIAPWYSKGLADPLMTSAAALSAWMLIEYTKTQKNITLVFALVCGAIAAMTKQAGLLWMLALAVCVCYGYIKCKWPKIALVLTGAAICVSLIWPLLIAPGFMNNQGVVSASMGNRSYIEQLLYASNEYLVKHPELSILLLATFYTSWKFKFLRLITLVAIVPMLLAWFVFGSYSLRLGAHVLALAGLVLVHSLSAARNANSEADSDSPPASTSSKGAAAIGIVLTLVYLAFMVFGVRAIATSIGTDLTDGAKTTLRVQYGDASKVVLDDIFASNSRVWTTSNYSYGPFYGRVPVAFPDYRGGNYSVDTLKSQILNFKADFAVQSGVVAMGPASEILKGLAQRCPDAFIPVLTPPNQKEFTLYKVFNEKLALESCR